LKMKVDRGSKVGLRVLKKLYPISGCNNCAHLLVYPGHPSICELSQDRMLEASYYVCESWSWHGDAASLEILKKGAQ
jgi:hypothetical protein